jgi:periplasmic protein TonB
MRFSPVVLGLLCAMASALVAQEPKKVTRSDALSAAVSKPQPGYPAMAKQLKLQGVVELEALIDESGKVEQVKIVTGNPIFTAPSAAALKAWKFTPFTSEGKPVKALAPVEFAFHLEN